MTTEKIAMQFQDLLDFFRQKESEILSSKGIRFRQFEYLKLISITENCTTSIIAERFKIKKPTVTIAINELISEGLLTKTQNKKDKRFFYLKVTRKGKNLITKIDKEREDLMVKALSNFSEKDIKLFSWTLNKILTEVETLI
jgi:DNA-binding MarR family transcriptional regulator